jgi:hypothetical protein
MSSKPEKTSHHSHQPPRLSIFFRNPLLLKIVTWLGSLSFIGIAGVVWADLQPISTPQTEAQALIKAAAENRVRAEDRQIYGPFFPDPQPQIPVAVTADAASDEKSLAQTKEAPLTVAPDSAAIVRPQHTDIPTSDNYTVGVNRSTWEPKTAAEFINIPVPAPVSMTIPSQTREIVSMTRSQIESTYTRTQTAVSQSVPETSIQTKPRSVPAVANLPTPRFRLQSIDRSRANLSTPVAITPQVIPLAGIKPTVVTPMKPSVTKGASTITPQLKSSETFASTPVQPKNSIDVSVPSPRTVQIVQPVAQLPRINEIQSVPTVPTIPSVRPAATSKPIAFANTGANEYGSELIYPLSSPAPTTSSFGWRSHPITGNRRFHSGIDIGAPMGAPVIAAGSGTIVSSGWLGGYGKAIVIQHNGVQQTLYGHLSEVFVQSGQRIEQGTVIGRVGSTGNSTGPHLHFETKVSTSDGWVAVDPGDDIKYALDNLRRSMPFAQRDLPPGVN